MADMKFNSVWNVWTHEIFNKDWSLQSYKHVYKIENVADLWGFLNNMDKFNYTKVHFFIMRDTIKPIWEDEMNRNGGICKIKIDGDALESWEDFVIYTINEDIVTNFSTINGISFNPKNNHTIIKVWNSCAEDISVTLHDDIKEKYKDNSIRYDLNIPEY
jgi:hypothetical protein